MAEKTESGPPAVLAMTNLLSKYLTTESKTAGHDFKPTSQDVIISAKDKSGTTWTQQICHGLRSGGDMNFEEICLVFPCLETAFDYGYTDLQAPQPYNPRMYKTHFWYHDTPKGAGKYIVIVRKPEDVAVSFYYYFQDWFFREGEISLDEFVVWFYLKMGTPEDFLQTSSQMHHIMSWYPHRLDPNVLWLHYEDLKQDRRECVRLIAEFLDIGKGDEKLQELVTAQASLEFMKLHSTKFDAHPHKLASKDRDAGYSVDTILKKSPGKVRTGKANEGKRVLSAHTLELMQKKWKEVIESETGLDSYEAFRNAINKELGRSFH